MLCERCKVIEFDDRRHGPEETTLVDGQVVLNYNGRKLNLDFKCWDSFPDLPVLQSSAQRGCGFCSHLRDSLRDIFAEVVGDRTVDPRVYLSGLRYVQDTAFDQGYIDDQNRYGYRGRWDGLFRLQILAKNVDGSFNKSLNFNVVADEGSFASQYLRIHQRPLAETLSMPNIDTMRSWIKNCLNHKDCTRDTFIPTRLIDLGREDQTIRLIITSEDDRFSDSEKSPAYLALSYCWGSPSISTGQLKTETSSLSSRLQSIPLEIVPKTIADSFTVTRALGYQFIWIDSLCIIQDDEADWQKESILMRRIYGSAMITLAATASKSTNDGFLERRKAELLPVPYKPTLHPEQEGQFYLQRSHNLEPRPDYWKNVQSREWNTRGWTFQEDLASQGRLYFGPSMFHYRCQREIRSENTQVVIFSSAVGMSWGRDLRSKGADLWPALVRDYSERKLTYPSDKLPALSALAHDMEMRTNSRYLAGLWENELVWHLLWECLNPIGGDYVALGQCETYRAPSWSWAARDSLISWTSSSKPSEWKDEVDIVEAKITAQGKNPLGSVTDGSLTLTGKLQRVSLLKVGSAQFEIIFGAPPGSPKLKVASSPNYQQGYVKLDGKSPLDASSGVQEERVGLLWLASFNKYKVDKNRRSAGDDPYTSAGLILSPIGCEEGSSRKFKRLGVFHFYRKDGPRVFQDSPTETITII